MYEYFNGENGKPLVRMNWAVARRCSAPGRVDEQIEKDVHNVVFVASDNDIRDFLSRFGSCIFSGLPPAISSKIPMIMMSEVNGIGNKITEQKQGQKKDRTNNPF